MIKLLSLLNENAFVGKTLINVDIQPEYQSFFSFKKQLWINFLNKNYNQINNIVFLYNGSETLGMITEESYKMWLSENNLSDEVIDGSYFYDKGYAWFRYCMDNYLDEDSVSNFVRFMYDNNIRDSREMNRKTWAQYLRQYGKTDKKEIYELLKCSGDCVRIPDLMDYVKKFNNIVLTGGAVNECLKEVEIALKALRKNYTILKEFTY